MKNPRMGRPRSKLPKAKQEVTVRVRRLIDFAHDGNVHEASQVGGVAYATLRDLYTGRSTNPSLRTLESLARSYGIYAHWFTDASQPAEVPAGGYRVFVPGFVHGRSPHIDREAIIPFAAHPLPALLARLDDELEASIASPSRPIVGEGANEKHWNRSVGEFLLGPLLTAEQHSRTLLIPDAATWSRDKWDDPEVLGVYVTRLKALGRYWETVFDDVISAVRREMSSKDVARTAKMLKNRK